MARSGSTTSRASGSRDGCTGTETLYLLGMLGSGGVFIGMLLRESRRTRRLLAEATAAQVRIEHLAHHDPLTDLPNRWLFKDRLDQALRQAHRHHGMVAMHCVDVDHFKTINDRFGHVTGDHVLVAVAQRMQDACANPTPWRGSAATSSRSFRAALSGSGAAHLAERLLAAFRVPLSVDGCEIKATVSIGIALYPRTPRRPRRCTGPPTPPSIAPRERAAIDSTSGSRATIGPASPSAITPWRADRRGSTASASRIALDRGTLTAHRLPADERRERCRLGAQDLRAPG